ncbi:MAG: ABC transporter ATP-binding protein [Acidobacteriota bacterium]|nr:ABC transporter ATP-binding protein [Acidobacteriota bacterium]MDQ3373415.1 ABC transporter ATP-binding protein [Acidobacteriota bacterium]
MSSISIQNLSKVYPPSFPRLKKFLHLAIKPSIEALRDVSFDIREGEIFGLIGRNGAGKTTLTKIIATLVQPSGGQVFVEGFDTVADEVKVRSMIGLATAEERSFYWRLTSLQNLMFFARLYGIKDEAARQRIVELFEQLDLNDLTDRNFSELSTGNKQRLAVARALIPNPPILLLDEPTRSLDPLAAGKMRELILSLKGISILLTSHNLNEVEELCNRVAIISRGEIRAVETPEKLRLFHKQTQTVKINFTNPCEKELKPILADYLEDFTIESKKDFLELEFSREASDDLLGKTVSLLNENGAKILDITTEKATLLDVLESYE